MSAIAAVSMTLFPPLQRGALTTLQVNLGHAECDHLRHRALGDAAQCERQRGRCDCVQSGQRHDAERRHANLDGNVYADGYGELHQRLGHGCIGCR